MQQTRNELSQSDFLRSKGYKLFAVCYEPSLHQVLAEARKMNYFELKVQRIKTDVKGLKKFEIWIFDGKRNPQLQCPCHDGDEAIWWQNENYNAFIDGNGEMTVTINGYEKCFMVECCPKCGKRFL